MGRNRQEKVKIEYRRTQVPELLLKKWTQAEIARELGVSQATISSDIKALRQDWQESRIRNFEEALDEDLQQGEFLMREAWKGWLRSQQPAETTRITQDKRGTKAEKTVRERSGDPQFLKIVQQANEKRRKLLGLDEVARSMLEDSQKWTDGNVPFEF